MIIYVISAEGCRHVYNERLGFGFCTPPSFQGTPVRFPLLRLQDLGCSGPAPLAFGGQPVSIAQLLLRRPIPPVLGAAVEPRRRLEVAREPSLTDQSRRPRDRAPSEEVRHHG